MLRKPEKYDKIVIINKVEDCMKNSFENVREFLETQFSDTKWIEDSGLSEECLKKGVEKIENENSSKALIKAKTFEFIVQNGQIAVDKFDIFQDKLNGAKILLFQRNGWEKSVIAKFLKEENKKIQTAWRDCGSFTAHSDFGHTSPNTEALLKYGFSGLIHKISQYEEKSDLSQKQKDFYLSCKIVLGAMQTVAMRLAEAVKPYNSANAEALINISKRAPQNSYEAMQLIVLYFFMHEYVCGTRVRTLGRVDKELYPFYKKDIENGVFTKSEIKEMLKFFLFKFWSAKVPFDLPFCLSGIDNFGNCVVNELTYLIVETYNELDIHSPKIHIRVSEKTPKDFVKLVLDCIRGGNSSFVFVNDNVAIKSLMRVGISQADAENYVPIGCYEPAVCGVEIGCTGNGGVNLAKAVEYVFTDGVDYRGGVQIGLKSAKIDTFDDFKSEIKKQISYILDFCVDFINSIETHYGEINPDPLLSCQYEHSLEQGIDVYEGGAKYNNTSFYVYSIATLVDSLCAVKRLVFDEKFVSLETLKDALVKNWEGYEELRTKCLSLREKYGNSNPLADSLSVEFAEFCSQLLLNSPNGRGGVYKPACFTIDNYVWLSEKTMATPDGRKYGDPLSKNLGASIGMDKSGITSLINSVTAFDHSLFPNGSVLDFVLHPSAVSGEMGLDALYGLLKTYFMKGGFAIHGNIFDSKQLKDAQIHPEKYKNLQVRVCGWNAYFVNLSKAEQDAFIKQSENKEK